MLKEVRIQILVKSILKFDITLLPIDFVAERYMCTLYQLHLVFTGQINIHYLLTIVPNVKFFMRPDVIRIRYRNPVVVFQFSYNTYNTRVSEISDSIKPQYTCIKNKKKSFNYPILVNHRYTFDTNIDSLLRIQMPSGFLHSDLSGSILFLRYPLKQKKI